MRARKYINRIDVYQTTPVDDGYGGKVLTDALIGSSWCNIKTLRAERITDLGLSENALVIEVNLRKRNDLTYRSKDMFFKYKGANYNILRIEHIDLDGYEIKILATTNDVNNG